MLRAEEVQYGCARVFRAYAEWSACKNARVLHELARDFEHVDVDTNIVFVEWYIFLAR